VAGDHSLPTIAVRRLPWGWIALIVAVAVILLVLGWTYGAGGDGAIYLVVGRAIAEGNVVYRDVFDHKPPGLYLAFAALWPLPVDPWTKGWLVGAVATAAALGVIGWLLRRRLPVDPFAFGVSMVGGTLLFLAYMIIGPGATTETVGAAFAAVAFAIGSVADGSGQRFLGRWLLAGAFVSAAVLTSFQLAPALLAVVTLALLGRRPIAAALMVVVGCAVVAGITASWLTATGAMSAAVDALVVYNRAYLDGTPLLTALPLRRMAWVLLIGAPIVAGVLLRLADIARRRDCDPAEVALLVWIAGWMAAVLIQGNFYAHYATAVIPPAVILAARGLDAHSPSARPARIDRAFAFELLAIAGVAVAISQPLQIDRSATRHAAEMLERLAAPGDRLFVWGNLATLYLETGLPTASRFTSMYPLTTPGYATPSLIAHEVTAWEKDPPDLIIDAAFNPAADSSPPLLQPWPFEGDPIPDTLDPLRAFVREHYREVERIGDWVIYTTTH
jgi:hypothetical protein